MLRCLRHQPAYANNSISRKLGSSSAAAQYEFICQIFYGLSKAIWITVHQEKQLSPTSSAVDFSYGFFSTPGRFLAPKFSSSLNFFWPSFKKPLYNLQPRIFYLLFFFTSLNLFFFRTSRESLSTIIISQTGAKYTPFALHVELFLTQLTHLRSETE